MDSFPHDHSLHEKIAEHLCALQIHVRDAILQSSRPDSPITLKEVRKITDSDTIYHIDHISEEAVTSWLDRNWPASLPMQLVMEGIPVEESLTFPRGTPLPATEWKCLLDPIDGTRCIMYDKRPAWVLAGVARQQGPSTSLEDIQVAAMTSIPTSREWRSDQIWAIREHGAQAVSHDIRQGKSQDLTLQPSRAADCRHGFATITRFFPDGLALLGTLEEQLWNELYPECRGNSPHVFNDQYLSSGGQLYELMNGHDRFIADLRPLVFEKLGIESSLAAHPYDLAALLVASETGVIIEDPLTGDPVDSPLDVTTPVAWAGYANSTIAAEIRPVLRKFIKKMI